MDAELRRALEAPERLAALYETGLLDEEAQETLDRYVRLVRRALDAPVGAVSLVDDHRQFFASQAGMGQPWASRRQTPLSHSFCKHVVAVRKALVVADARRHPRVKSNPAIDELGVEAYAGFPICTSDGFVLGSFCAIDDKPREWTERDLDILSDLAAGVGREMDLRRRAQRAERSERELSDLNARLLEEQDAQTVSTRAAVHDLRTPLSVLMLGVSNLLSHDASDNFPEIAKLLDVMKRNVGYAASLVETMHEITRLSAGAQQADCIDAIAIVREACNDTPCPEHLDLVVDCADEPLQVEMDPTSLRRCVDNLVSNALRFADERVRIALSRREDELELSVEDDGPGLPTPKAYRRAWEPNARFHLDEGRSGSGLGLSIVRANVQEADGHVRAKPSPDLGGAKFIVILPLAD